MTSAARLPEPEDPVLPRHWPSRGVDDPVVDVLGEPYYARTLPGEGDLVSTLVHLPGPAGATRAVLYVHGFADYFFQKELAEFHHRRGEHFYALDLHRYGRSLRPGQIPYDMADVTEYFDELDLARSVILADGATSIVVDAHSTGGLITSSWLADRGAAAVDALVLNSPFLELPVGPLARTVLAPAVDFFGAATPGQTLPLPDPGLYGRSLHVSGDGEWDFNTDWKPLRGASVRLGWLAAVRKAQKAIGNRLGLDVPILVLCSTATFNGTTWRDEVNTGDAVLNADRIADLAPKLGNHVTCVRITDARHDVILSRPEVRAHAYRIMDRWLDGHLPG